jgi:hypothetical protein
MGSSITNFVIQNYIHNQELASTFIILIPLRNNFQNMLAYYLVCNFFFLLNGNKDSVPHKQKFLLGFMLQFYPYFTIPLLCEVHDTLHILSKGYCSINSILRILSELAE